MTINEYSESERLESENVLKHYTQLGHTIVYRKYEQSIDNLI